MPQFSRRTFLGAGAAVAGAACLSATDLGYRDFVGLECRPTDELAAAKAVAAADVW